MTKPPRALDPHSICGLPQSLQGTPVPQSYVVYYACHYFSERFISRTHLYIKLHETTPKRVIQTLTTYFREEQNLKVNDIQYPYYTILRVEVAPFSKEWLNSHHEEV